MVIRKKSINYLKLMLCIGLCACANVLPEPSAEITQLRLIRYRDAHGNGLIPVARSAGEARSKGWQRWLSHHAQKWDLSPNQKLEGQTQWCAQWQNGEKQERICQRDGGMIWFGRGILRDETALREAAKIWIGR